MKSVKKILFIINPVSGIGEKKTIEEKICAYSGIDNYHVEIAITEHQGHATELAKSAAENNYDIVVAVGGDGSVNEVAKGIFETNTSLGIIPAGSGNGLARYLCIPCDIDKALNIIFTGKSIPIDTATINKELFVSIAGIGFDALIAEKFAEHKRRGFFTYSTIAAKEYFLYKSNKFILYIDGKRIKRKAFFISIANAGQFGYNVTISPNALINDGYIDVCILKKIPFYATLFVLLKLYKKTIDSSKFIEIIRAREVRIIRNMKQKVHIDGDPLLTANELTIKVIHNSLNVIVPINFNKNE